MSTVTKADLVKIVAKEFGYSKTEARQYVDAFFESLTESIVNGQRIEARGFGAFTVKHANAKAGARNPKTGERVFVPARRKVAFKPGRILREALASSTSDEEQPKKESEGKVESPGANHRANHLNAEASPVLSTTRLRQQNIEPGSPVNASTGLFYFTDSGRVVSPPRRRLVCRISSRK